MKNILWIIAIAVMPIVGQGYAATTDPFVLLYRISGVRDDNRAAQSGVATSFHCTNKSTVSEQLAIKILNYNGDTVAENTITVLPNHTVTLSTHAVFAFASDLILNTGMVDQGFAGIASTTTDVFCSAMMLDASAATPNGIALHLVRFNSASGTQE